MAFKSRLRAHGTEFFRDGPLSAQYTCRGLEVQPRSLSPHFIMVCSQIHAPPTLPNPIHMHLTNRNFLSILYCLEQRLFFLIPRI
jgi:hypothetical protein